MGRNGFYHQDVGLSMMLITRSQTALTLLCTAAFAGALQAQSKPPGTDILVLTDGEKLIGHFKESIGDSVVFESDLAGKVKVDWSKVKELHTTENFAVLKKGIKLGRHPDESAIPQGKLSVSDNTVAVAAPGPQTVNVPVNQIQDVVDQAAFNRAVLQKQRFYEDWTGTTTFGVSLVKATQSSQTYTSSIALERTVPAGEWINPRYRTILNFTSSYGELTQPGSPTLKTSIFHGQGEQDEYFSPRAYGFESANFDHDYSQGLNLQQTYGGGVGLTLLKTDEGALDVRAEVTYVKQQFFAASQDQNLLGSVFSEAYNRKWKSGITFHELVQISPAWTNTHASSANGALSLSIPVFKRLGFTVGSSDTFLEDPSPGFRKNSFQFTTGMTYALGK
jgi:hypothetical protein